MQLNSTTTKPTKRITMATGPVNLRDSPRPALPYNPKQDLEQATAAPYVSQQPAPNPPPSYTPASQDRYTNTAIDLERGGDDLEMGDLGIKIVEREENENENGKDPVYGCRCGPEDMCSCDCCCICYDCSCRCSECVPGIWTMARMAVLVVVVAGVCLGLWRV
ncbi:uncharacterized protein BDZ99DRAFT_577305 [Mytilinidion resinicola]|uniref:Uncharacterized protein n=1 Tax=Mytilinidion resinicola TaxID=574789 RepID=A0A6A6Y0U4_9PEZI|nr:uncharacterized protein BDZ99DRAFT_577305 [Mytilinidion resinicola]KAF2801855.1 hypothetical protein BDZ99DRAFT_577305 [Mytilinidion resinicola]